MYYLYIIGALFLMYIVWKRNHKENHLVVLTKAAAKWATTAQQDESPYVAVMHANYACGYLQALKDVSTPEEIQRQTGVEFNKFQEHILNVQDMVTQKVIQKCPEFAGNIDLYLSSIAQN